MKNIETPTTASELSMYTDDSIKVKRLRLYVQLAEELKEQIRRGIFCAGDRLPSERVLAVLRRVSINTVQEAYRLLEDEQWIVIKSQSGAYVASTWGNDSEGRHKPDSQKADAGLYQQLAASSRSDPSPFSAAFLHASLLPSDRLAVGMANILRKQPSVIGSISLAPGSIELRQQIARRAVEWSANIDPGRLVITNGGDEAIQLCLRAVTRPGDTVVIESPAYPGFIQALNLLGLKALEVPSEAEGIDIDFLQRVVSSQDISAVLLSTTVSNPTGATLSLIKKRRLVQLAVQHQIPIIEDATLSDLHYEGRSEAAQGFDSSGLIMLCASLTKTIAPSMRLGWIDGGKFADRIVELKRCLNGGQPQISELTLTDYLAAGGITKRMRSIRRVMRSQVYQMAETVLRYFPRGTALTLPTGGYMLWVALPSTVESLALHRKANNLSIGIAPGVLFSTSVAYHNYIRLNCGALAAGSIDAVIKLSRIVEQMAG